MPWQDQIRPATFRGVPFHVASAESSGGRRTVRHEYPFRDDPFVEDMGRKARAFPVEGYVVGPNYLTARNALIEALEKPGVGELVHPYYKALRVAVVEYRVRESSERGGVATFSIDFVETPVQAVQPRSLVDAASKVASSGAAARTAVGAEFLVRYQPGPLLGSVQTALRQASRAVTAVLSTVTVGAQQLALLERQIAELTEDVGALSQVPADMLSALVGVFDLLDSGEALATVYAYDPGTRPPATTANREQEQINFDATYYLTQRLAAIRAAEVAPDQTYDSFDNAIAARDRLTALLDEQAGVAADDAYPALMQLRADLVKAVPGADSDLPRLLTYTPGAVVPSLVLAHTLYGNLDLEADLVARNRVRNPLLVPALPLQVLGDV